MSLEQLKFLAGDSEPAVSDRALYAISLTEAYQAGGISESEYQELLKDLIRSDRIDAECSNLETKTLLVTAVYALTHLA